MVLDAADPLNVLRGQLGERFRELSKTPGGYDMDADAVYLASLIAEPIGRMIVAFHRVAVEAERLAAEGSNLEQALDELRRVAYPPGATPSAGS